MICQLAFANVLSNFCISKSFESTHGITLKHKLKVIMNKTNENGGTAVYFWIIKAHTFNWRTTTPSRPISPAISTRPNRPTKLISPTRPTTPTKPINNKTHQTYQSHQTHKTQQSIPKISREHVEENNLRTSRDHPGKILRTSREHPANILRTSKNILRRSENISEHLRTPWEHLDNILRSSRKRFM